MSHLLREMFETDRKKEEILIVKKLMKIGLVWKGTAKNQSSF